MQTLTTAGSTSGQDLTTGDVLRSLATAVHNPIVSVGMMLSIILVGTTLAVRIMRNTTFTPSRNYQENPAPRAEDDPSIQKRREEFVAYQKRHVELTHKWMPYLNNPDVFLTLPGMRDMSIQQVGNFIDALAAADHARIDKLPDSYTGPVMDHAYPAAVRRAEKAFAEAKKIATHMREHQMSADEVNELALIRQMLATAMDDAASPNERRLAYQQASRKLERLGIELPEPIHEQLEKKMQPLLEAGPTGATPVTSPSERVEEVS